MGQAERQEDNKGEYVDAGARQGDDRGRAGVIVWAGFAGFAGFGGAGKRFARCATRNRSEWPAQCAIHSDWRRRAALLQFHIRPRGRKSGRSARQQVVSQRLRYGSAPIAARGM